MVRGKRRKSEGYTVALEIGQCIAHEDVLQILLEHERGLRQMSPPVIGEAVEGPRPLSVHLIAAIQQVGVHGLESNETGKAHGMQLVTIRVSSYQ